MSAGHARDRRSRTLAEAALVSLLRAAGDRSVDLVLIGGLVPEHLVDTDDPHQGTTDVDLLLDIGVEYDRDDADYGWLEGALRVAGFVPATPNTGWRWVTDVDGFPVTVEFLVDVADNLDQEIALPGATFLGAKNLRGPGPALEDAHLAVVGGERVRMTDIGGYLTAKGAAAFWRRADKDLYDFAWVIVHATRDDPDRAPSAVAAVLSTRPDRDRSGAVFGACALYETADGNAAGIYADVSARTGDPEDRSTLALDAVLAVRSFRDRLSARLDRTD